VPTANLQYLPRSISPLSATRTPPWMRRTPSGAHAPVPGASTATVPKPAGRFSRAGSSFIHLAVGGALGQRRGQSLPGRRV